MVLKPITLSKAFLLRGGSSVLAHKVSLPQAKMLMQAFLSLFNILCWAIPNYNKNSLLGSQSSLSLASTFAAGVFLMLSFSHMIPHAIEQWGASATGSNWLTTILGGYQLSPEMAVLCHVAFGYLTVLFFDKVLFSKESEANEMEDRLISAVESKTEGNKYTSNNKPLSSRTAILLLVAMSLHSFFETLALGITNNISAAIIMTLSIASHQPAESLSLLLAFLKTDLSPTNRLIWLSIFSLIGPLGITFGMLVQKYVASPILEATIAAVIAGSFIYIGATEIIPEEFEDSVKPADKWKRFGGIIVGLVLVVGVNLLSHKLENL